MRRSLLVVLAASTACAPALVSHKAPTLTIPTGKWSEAEPEPAIETRIALEVRAVRATDEALKALGIDPNESASPLAPMDVNAVLDTAEASGKVETVSASRIVSLNGDLAQWRQTLSTSTARVDALGGPTLALPSTLSLDVTPRAGADGRVRLHLRVRSEQARPTLSGAAGQPAIDSRETSTDSVVADGSTAALGGTSGQGTGETRDPAALRHVIVFVTPRIVPAETSQVASADEAPDGR